MTTTNTLSSASSNGVSVTRYVLRLKNDSDSYVKTWTSEGWSHTVCNEANEAFQFSSMTLALCVGFCLGFGAKMETELVYGQTELPLQ